MNSILLKMTVNGDAVEVAVEPGEMLLDVLRNKLQLKGVKEACREGECGACVVLLDGLPVNSCLVPAMKAFGRAVTTVEGLGDSGQLDRVQEAFVETGAIECGYCTPGMVLSAKALLARNPHPTPDEIRLALSGHLCRCGTYVKVIEAVELAASRHH